MNNIYLTGIMGCGKTTVGDLVAKHQKKLFFDVDSEIEKKIKMSIPEIFEKYGEEKFREIETKVLKNISKKVNAVVACGGGIVLKNENIQIMKDSGVVLFINRDINEIAKHIKKDNRPLLKESDDLINIYEKRESIYKNTCNEEILNISKTKTVNHICLKYL